MIIPPDSAARLNVVNALAQSAASRLGARAWLDACLARIAEREPTVQAWVALDPQRARAAAGAVDASPAGKSLAGLPIGVKDIIDVAGWPTGCVRTARRSSMCSATAPSRTGSRAPGPSMQTG